MPDVPLPFNMSNERRRPFPFDQFEPRWQRVWAERQTFHTPNPGEPGFDATRPKYYVLDMFPYPSGAGLHVGHPEGYTATDILGRFKKMSGFNVLHPMGWDAFGLPAEQYAIKTGQHPRATTEANVANFRAQLQRIGFGYDWQREVNTTDPGYFKWTQWIFLQLYNSYFDYELNKAQPIALLEDALSDSPQRRSEWEENMYLLGTHQGWRECTEPSREEWRESFITRSRLAYISSAPVNWCPELGTVLANEEVVDGKSEVGGHPVERRPMRQWMLRITAYAQRLIDELDGLDWPESIKIHQRNWIGRSEGAEVRFAIAAGSAGAPPAVSSAPLETPDVANATIASNAPPRPMSSAVAPTTAGGAPALPVITVFTTRPDTLYGATYMVLAPEHLIVDQIVTEEQAPAIEEYREKAARKSDLERAELAKDKTGVFTGAFAINPVNGERIPIWVADYVLTGYGTGAIMAVPAHDERDWEFAKKFALPIREVVSPEPRLGLGGGSVCDAEPLECFVGEGYAIHSGPLDGLPTAAAKTEITARLEAQGLAKKTINFKLRDWLFSRQRYWGEPFPIVWENGKHRAVAESELPVVPPELADFKPTGTPEPPLSKAKDWVQYSATATRELNTMPQWAGSCWYYLRYMDNANAERFVGAAAEKYWTTGEVTPTWADALHELYTLAETSDENAKRYIQYGTVSDREARRIQDATGLDLHGYRRMIDLYAIRHILKKYGDAKAEESRGQVAVTEDILLRIPEIVANPDRILAKGKNSEGRDLIAYEKQVNGVVFFVEEASTKHDLLAATTMYVKMATASDAACAACSDTSETVRRTRVLVGPPSSSRKSQPPHGGVDLYVGGTEHAVLHLLYARFWHKVLFDLGHVSTPEPFQRLVNQGLILGEDGQKMSKSRGNVVNPDDVISEYGADSLRLYEMFMGPLEATKPWSMSGVEGVFRFLARVWRLVMEENQAGEWQLSAAVQDVPMEKSVAKVVHATIKKVGEDIEALSFNTAIAQMMVCTNALIATNPRPVAAIRLLLQVLNPFAPHLTEELNAAVGQATRLPSPSGRPARCSGESPEQTAAGESPAPLPASAPEHSLLADQSWPAYDPVLLIEDEIELPVQVNGKLRDKIVVKKDATQADIEAIAKAAPKVAESLAGKTIKKLIVVPGRLVNIVVA